jgi:O-antigen/teichoic acid export membrane protein
MPLVPSSVGVMVGLYVDRIAIARLMTLGDVGLFGVGYRLSSLTSLLMVGFVSALTPLIYARHREPDTPAQLARIFRTFAALALAVCLALALFARDIVAVATTPDYVGAAAVVPLLAPALVLSSMYIFAPGPGIAKRTGIISTINIGVAVMNTLLNFLLIPILGILGAATATFLSNATGFSVNMVASQRLYPVPHDWRRLGLAALGTIVLFVLGASDIVAGMASVALRGAIMVLAATWFVTVGLISPGELRGLLRQAGRARRLTARSTVPSDDAEDGHRSL